MHTHIYINTRIHNIYLHTYIHTYIRTYIHTHMHSYAHTYIHTHTHTYIHIYTYIHTYIHTYILTYIHTYIHTYILTYIHILSSMFTCLLNYLTYKQTRVHVLCCFWKIFLSFVITILMSGLCGNLPKLISYVFWAIFFTEGCVVFKFSLSFSRDSFRNTK